MKKILPLILAAGFLSILNAELSAAEEAPAGLAVSSELDLVSKYVWRGIQLSAAEAYQPSVTLSAHGFAANAWLNYSVDGPQPNKFNELDLTLSYERELKSLSVSPGFTFYSVRGSASYGEAYLKLSYPVAFLNIFTDHYFSMFNDAVTGGYYGDAGLGYEKQFAGESVFTGSALLGWGNTRFNTFNYEPGGMTSRLNVLVLDTALTFKPSAGGRVSVRPHLTYFATLPRTICESVRAAAKTPDNLVIGVAAGYDF